MKSTKLYSMFLLLGFLFLHNKVFANQVFTSKSGKKVSLSVQDHTKGLQNEEIATQLCGNSFKRTFINSGIPISEFGFSSVEDVYNFYAIEDIAEELTLFRIGKTIFVQAIMHEAFGDKLVGWVHFIPDENKDNSVYVSTLVIDPDFHGEGIGRKLLFSILEDESLLPNTQIMHLHVRKANNSAIDFYRHVGFIESNFLESKALSQFITTYQWTKRKY